MWIETGVRLGSLIRSSLLRNDSANSITPIGGTLAAKAETGKREAPAGEDRRTAADGFFGQVCPQFAKNLQARRGCTVKNDKGEMAARKKTREGILEVMTEKQFLERGLRRATRENASTEPVECFFQLRNGRERKE